MMDTYQKINGIYKRHKDGPKKGKFIMGEWAVPELGYLAKNRWEFTEKIDGTNIRIHFHRYEDSLSVEFGGRTDNALIPKALLSYLQGLFPDSPSGSGENATVGRWMVEHDLTDVTLYGEGYGEKIQNGGKYFQAEVDHNRELEEGQPRERTVGFVLFDVKIDGFWLDRENVDDVATNLGIGSVPTIGYGTLQDAIDIVSSGLTFNDRGAAVRWGSGGLQSAWGNFEAEGIVARPVVPLFNRKGERVVAKIKAVDFK